MACLEDLYCRQSVPADCAAALPHESNWIWSLPIASLNSSSLENEARTSAHTISHATTTPEFIASRRTAAEAGPNTGSGRRMSRRTDESTALRTLERAWTAELFNESVGSVFGVQNSVNLIHRMVSGSAFPKQGTLFCELKSDDRSGVQPQLASYLYWDGNWALRRNNAFHESSVSPFTFKAKRRVLGAFTHF